MGDYIYGTRSLSAAQIIVAKRITNEGYAICLGDYDWSFLKERASLSVTVTTTSTADGKPVKDNGTSTVTVDDAIFDPLMVGEDVTFSATDNAYEITSYTNTKIVVVSGDASGEADADTITVPTGYETALPTDFGGEILDTFAYAPGTTSVVLKETTAPEIEAMRAAGNYATTYPYRYAIVPLEYVAATGQRYKVMWYPKFNAAKTLYYQYRVNEDLETADSTYPRGGRIADRAMRAAALMIAEEERGHDTGPKHNRYQMALAAAIRRDAQLRPSNLGYNGDDSDATGSRWMRAGNDIEYVDR